MIQKIPIPLLPAAALLFILFGCFYGLGAYALLDNNEGVYASIARTMAEGGDLVIPHLNGLPYIEKPPLFYWLTAASFRIFGFGEWQARLVPALALFTTILSSSLFVGRRAGTDAGAVTSIILSTSLVMLLIGRMVYFNMLFICFITMAHFALYRWYESGVRAYLRVAYIMAGLAVMTKGPLGVVLIGGTWLCFLMLQRSPGKMYWRAFDIAGMAIFLGIVVPWHVLAGQKDPGFYWFYFINEHVLRFLNMRQPHDYYTGPFWYYIPRMALYLLPWSFLLPVFFQRQESLAADHIRLRTFLWCWLGWPMVFFSLSLAKANYYMVVGAIPLAILLAFRVMAMTRQKPNRLLAAIVACVIITMALFLAASLLLCQDWLKLQPYCFAITPALVVVAGICATASLYALWKLPLRASALLLASTIVIALPAMINWMNVSGQLSSQKEVADYLNTHDVALPTAIYTDFEEFSALAYYLDHPMVIVGSESGDLSYSKHYHPELGGFNDLNDWLQQASSSTTPKRLLVRNHYLPKLRGYIENSSFGAHLQMETVPFKLLSVITFSRRN